MSTPSRPSGGSAQRPQERTRIGYAGLLETLLRYRGEARCATELDRRHLLFRLGSELGLEEEALLRKGFDKAYRRTIEGV